MARYVGAAVAVAAIAMVNNAVANNHKDAGESASDALAAGLASCALMMAIWSAAGVLLIRPDAAPPPDGHAGRRARGRGGSVEPHTIPIEPAANPVHA